MHPFIHKITKSFSKHLQRVNPVPRCPWCKAPTGAASGHRDRARKPRLKLSSTAVQLCGLGWVTVTHQEEDGWRESPVSLAATNR